MIRKYAAEKKISLLHHRFINELSEEALPKLLLNNPLNFILIDGKHAFPWPFIDWFYSVVHLRKNGILMVDDTHLLSGKILCDFMKKDPNWEFLEILDGRTEIFRKTTDDVRNVAWHMQPFLADHYNAMQRAKKESFSGKKISVKLGMLMAAAGFKTR